MFIQFNKEKMHIQVVCGALEEYTPSPEMQEVVNKVYELKEKLTKFQEEIVFPEIKEIDNLIEELNPKTET